MEKTDRGQSFSVSLSISKARFERLYRGQAKTVIARDQQGRTIRFPAMSLRPFLSHAGIQGMFIIRVDERNRLLDIQRQP